MAQFRLNQPIETREATVVVDAGLAPGTYRFQLVVVDGAGNESRPTVAVLVISERPS